MQSGLESLSDKHLYLANKQARKEEFDYRCAYCGVKPVHLTIDHVIPRSQDGSNDPSNLLPACRNCNESKGSRSLTNWYTKKNPRYSSERWERIVEVLAIDQQLSV
jgi:5-methylcytosine-specific restriction endonuclease McrA